MKHWNFWRSVRILSSKISARKGKKVLSGEEATAECLMWEFFARMRVDFGRRENFVALIDPSHGELECVLLLDKGFKARHSKRTGHNDYFIVQNLCRKLILQCESERQALEWAEEATFVLDRGSLDFVTPNRFLSFAPPRQLTECKWIVDGATYFEAVGFAMESAKEEIFIADWWLSPEIYLKRPTTQGHYWQLDYLLRRKAREGVKIYVLLYKELGVALGINSAHTEQKLSRMHPNIQVLRHPYVSKGILFWAHHEKIVCVDQMHAFVGGLDLCFGRWDDYQHRLTDLGNTEDKLSVLRHSSTSPVPSALPSTSRRTISTPEIKRSISKVDILDVPVEEEDEAVKPSASQKKPTMMGIYRKFQARRVFESIKRQLSAEGVSPDGNLDLLVQSLHPEQPADVHRTVQEIALTHLGLERKFRLWHGKDYVNFISRDFQELHQPYSDIIDRSKTPRMPWHDIGLYVRGMAARDIARHFILRWNNTKEEICPKSSAKNYLMPKSYSVLIDAPHILQDVIGTLYTAECQVLRSLSHWSGSINDVEDSIHRAYLKVIQEAKKFIYIENQFFISLPERNGSIYNGIADALFNRIIKAHREKKNFFVYVVLPLLPAFEGEVGTGSGTLIRAILHWNYRSICRGSDSLLGRLSRHMRDPSKYIGFYGLRTYDVLNEVLVTELVYVHSKFLLADDRVAIIGSANINDRSQLGSRDSEMAVIVRDTNGPGDPGQFCHSLRAALFREHLGLMHHSDPNIDLSDPSNPQFHRLVWEKIAASNTEIYEEVFRCLPTDNVKSFGSLKKYTAIAELAIADPEAAKEKLQNIRGYLVQFPLSFLCDQNLEPHLTTMEGLLPTSTFT